MTPDKFRDYLIANIRFILGRDPDRAVADDWRQALMIFTRREGTKKWLQTQQMAQDQASRRVYYLSLEFMIGRILEDALSNLELLDMAKEVLGDLGLDANDIIRGETDPALGNGGLGRLAACYLESLASLGYPAIGYGIRYSQGLFHQDISGGWQQERPDNWLRNGSRWEFKHPDVCYDIGFGGRSDAALPQAWQPGEIVRAVANDYPIIGWQGRSALTLRLWSAHSDLPLDLNAFNQGDYVGAMAAQSKAEAISQVLYPNDSSEEGRRLRLSQEYFFSAASVQDILARHLRENGTIESLPDKACIQLNDTHPAIAIPELVRLLIDDHGQSLNTAWDMARRTFNYTNHTLLPEALESWHLGLVGRLLPRHLDLIYEINGLILAERRQDPGNQDPYLSDISLIEEQGGGSVRMGHLAFLGSTKTNGVSALHSDLVRQQLFAPLEKHFPGKITNVTNGVTQRRWLGGCNPRLAKLIDDAIGPGWRTDLSLLKDLEAHNLAQESQAVKHANKADFSDFVASTYGKTLDPSALIDSQIKRMHEYKRQLLSALHAVALYLDIKDGKVPAVPRVKVFSGKAAASYTRAKEIIRLIHAIADLCEGDPQVSQHLKIVFLPNYNVSLAERIIPATDLSEQISTAGMEASGTGNMKFALNGALTIGTLDGANVEIREHVGAENFELFGLTAEEVARRRQRGACVSDLSNPDDMKVRVLRALGQELFGEDLSQTFAGLISDLRHHDYFLLLADFDDYLAAQKRVEVSYANPAHWAQRTYLNIARMGYFSSDRSVKDYADHIWGLSPLDLSAHA